MHRARVLLAVLTLSLFAAACEIPLPYQQPRTMAVPASIDRTGATDVSVAFRDFLAQVPDGTTIQFPVNGRFRMEQTLVIRNRRALTFNGNGSEIFATTQGDRERSNIQTIYGGDIAFNNLKVRGANPNAGVGDAAWVVAMEGQQGFDVRSVAGFFLTNVTVTDTYGDFVYLGRDEDGPWSSNVRISGSTFERNGRQGITMTAARDVIIENNRLDEMRRAAFDFEPQHLNYGVDNVIIRNNSVGTTRLLFIAAEAKMPVNNVTIIGNRVERPLQVWVLSQDTGVPHYGWKIIGNVSGTVAGAASHTVMRFANMHGLELRDNYQAMDPRRLMYAASLADSCGTIVSGNSFPGAVAPTTSTGTC